MVDYLDGVGDITMVVVLLRQKMQLFEPESVFREIVSYLRKGDAMYAAATEGLKDEFKEWNCATWDCWHTGIDVRHKDGTGCWIGRGRLRGSEWRRDVKVEGQRVTR